MTTSTARWSRAKGLLLAAALAMGAAGCPDTQDDDDSAEVTGSCAADPLDLFFLCIHELPGYEPATGTFGGDGDIPDDFMLTGGTRYGVRSWATYPFDPGTVPDLRALGQVTVLQRGTCQEDDLDVDFQNALLVFEGDTTDALAFGVGAIEIDGLHDWTVAPGEVCPAKGPATCWEHLHNRELLVSRGTTEESLYQGETATFDGLAFTLRRAEETSGDLTCESPGLWYDLNWTVVPEE